MGIRKEIRDRDIILENEKIKEVLRQYIASHELVPAMVSHWAHLPAGMLDGYLNPEKVEEKQVPKMTHHYLEKMLEVLNITLTTTLTIGTAPDYTRFRAWARREREKSEKHNRITEEFINHKLEE